MKEFRKNEQGFFICEECGISFSHNRGLAVHIVRSHKNQKQYYDKWLKEEGEGFCKICGKETKFAGFKKQYINCCSKECVDKYRFLQTQKSIQEKYGVDFPMQSPIIKQHLTENNFKKYGVINVFQIDSIRKKANNSIKEFYKNDVKVLKAKIKYEKTSYKKYGVKNISQLGNNKNAYKIQKFRNTDIWAQGSYELDFLEKYYNKYPDIQRGPRIKYFYENKEHFYFPDFFIPSLNLIIECKNKNLAERDKLIIMAKENATIINGYNYIMIIDKLYNNFNSIYFKNNKL